MSEPEAWRQVVNRQDKEIAELRAQLAAVTQERDQARAELESGVYSTEEYDKVQSERDLLIARIESGYMEGAYARLDHLQKCERDLAAITEALGCKAGYELQTIADRDGVITDTDGLRQENAQLRAVIFDLKQECKEIDATLEVAQAANCDYLVLEHDLRNALAGVQRERAVLQTALDESRRSGRAILAAHNELVRLVGLYRLSARNVANKFRELIEFKRAIVVIGERMERAERRNAQYSAAARKVARYFRLVRAELRASQSINRKLIGECRAANRAADIAEFQRDRARKAAAAWKSKAKDYRAQLMGYIHVQFTSSDKSAMFLRLQHNHKILWGRKIK